MTMHTKLRRNSNISNLTMHHRLPNGGVDDSLHFPVVVVVLAAAERVDVLKMNDV